MAYWAHMNVNGPVEPNFCKANQSFRQNAPDVQEMLNTGKGKLSCLFLAFDMVNLYPSAA